MDDKHIKLGGKIESLSAPDEYWVIGAILKEKLSTLSDMTVEFVTKNPIGLNDLIGQPMHIEVEDKSSSTNRFFSGVCVSIEAVGELVFADGKRYHYIAYIRHWLWMLQRASDNRIFQNMTAVQIIEQVFGDHGFSDYEKKLRESYEERVYCVQYRETDYDFVCRLMEEEGIYFFYDTAPTKGMTNKLILCDDASGSHTTNPGQSELKFTGTGGRRIEGGETVSGWSRGERVISGKVTLNDYDMLTPTTEHFVSEPTGISASHSHKSYELYHYPAKYRKDTGRGQRLARVRMEAEEIRYQTRRGGTFARSLAVGYQFKLTEHDDDGGKFLVTSAVHYLRPTTTMRVDPGQLDKNRKDIQYPEEMEETDYICYFTAIPERTQFRAPLVTPWPEIAGLHTAEVVGKSGEEIWTDEHGRIKVKFPWDRVNAKDENASCWIRVATPWSGQDWGMVAIPRIGQEVVIQFEEGDPDRPICTGMLWNNDRKPAYTYPDNATELGIRTNSSKGGGGYNEMMFDDKAGSELMRVQAQKDHQFLIKNKSVVTIGQPEVDTGDHDEEGSLSEVIRNHVTRTIQEGSHYYTIEQGDEEFKIETGSQTIEIETDKTQTIQQNYTTEIAQGDHSTTVTSGDLSIDVSSGSIKIEAAQKIELIVGGSSITIDPTSITMETTQFTVTANATVEISGSASVDISSDAMCNIAASMVDVAGDAMLTAGAPMVDIAGDAMTMISGGVTMIN